MEFGILGAEPSGSFREEEVVGHEGSEEADRRGGGRFKGTVGLLSPSSLLLPRNSRAWKGESSRRLACADRSLEILPLSASAGSLQSRSFASLLLTQHLLGVARVGGDPGCVSGEPHDRGRRLWRVSIARVSCHFGGRFPVTTVGLLWS